MMMETLCALGWQITEEVLEAEPNIYRELNEGTHELENADLTKVKNILGMGYGAVASSGTPAWVKNAQRSPLSRIIRPTFWLGVYAFVKMVLVVRSDTKAMAASFHYKVCLSK